LTFIDFSGTARREIPGVIAPGARWQVLHATAPAPDHPVVRGVRAAGTSVVIDADSEPFGIVLHLPEAHDEH
jgi:hypothetical protein